MLQQPEADDYAVATGETQVREFCERAFDKVGLDYSEYVKTDEQFYRPAEVDLLIGDATKARRVLGCQQAHTLRRLVDEMVESDLAGTAHLVNQPPPTSDNAGAGVS
jgi:GDPmannose 4,6-dehydratase